VSTNPKFCSQCGIPTKAGHLNHSQCIAALRERNAELEWTIERIELRRAACRNRKRVVAAEKMKAKMQRVNAARWSQTA
jgi:hypothetical protein